MARIGLLALQGGYAAHGKALAALGHDPVEVRSAEQLGAVDGLVLPGGESTTHLRLIDRFDLAEPLDAFLRSGKPALATCCGLILSARAVTQPAQRSFGWLDVQVARNAWGRQVHSFQADSDPTDPKGPFGGEALPMLFIRAPRIEAVGPDVEVLASYRGEPVMVRQGAVVGASFHPELTNDRRVHAAVFGSDRP